MTGDRRCTAGNVRKGNDLVQMVVLHPPWPNEAYSLAEFIDMLNAFAPQAGEAPGKQRIYTHAGYVLLQLALERYARPIKEIVRSILD